MINEHHLKVERTARYFSLGNMSDSIEEVWFVLHGYGFLGDGFLKRFEALEQENRLIIAPEAMNRFYLRGFFGKVGATWMTREDRLNEIDDYVGYLDRLSQTIFSQLKRPPKRTMILGFSQGTATASRWLSMGNVEADRLIIWAGGLPPDLDYEKHRDKINRARPALVFGTADEYISREDFDKEVARLTELKINFSSHEFDGGHEIEPALLAQIWEGEAK